MAPFLKFIAVNFGVLREDHILTTWGPGIRRSYHLGPLSVVSDIIVLYGSSLLHFQHTKGLISLTPEWVRGYNEIETKI